MITGFNTDVERDGVVYHVQTEDKGLDSPLILSLVYSGGEILAAKRTPYDDLIATGFTDEALSERLKRQHRLICAAINAGRIEELKQMSVRRDEGISGPADPDAKSEEIATDPITPPVKVTQPPKQPTFFPVRADPISPPVKAVQPPKQPTFFPVRTDPITPPEKAVQPPKQPFPLLKVDQSPLEARVPPIESDHAPRKGAEPDNPPPRPPVHISDEFIIETSAERPVSAEPQPRIEKVVAEIATTEPAITSSLAPPAPLARKASSPQESAYTVYDSRRPSRSKKGRKQESELALSILDDEEFYAGESVIIRVLLQRHSGETEKPIGGAVISVKVLGANFRPQIYSVKTQRDGVALVSIDLPSFSSGRAAVVVRAEAQQQSVELRRVIHPAG